MTRQESFKRRVRARMSKTGERYMTARRQLIERASHGDDWVSDPEMGDRAIVEATGKGWDEWREIIDAGAGREAGHGAIVDHVMQGHGVDGWWAQTVAVGYERIVGLRLPHQVADGTFTAGKSKTIGVDADTLRAMLLDDDDRDDLFPGLDTELRSNPASKVLRIGMESGVAQIAIESKPGNRVTVTVAHEKLATPGEVEEWKSYWAEWLDALDRA